MATELKLPVFCTTSFFHKIHESLEQMGFAYDDVKGADAIYQHPRKLSEAELQVVGHQLAKEFEKEFNKHHAI